MISEADIQRVKDSAVIHEVIGEFIKLKKEGTNYVSVCPFHQEKTPSFKVSPAKGIYKCFGCGKSGDSITFLMEHEKLSYPDAIHWLAKKYNIEMEKTQSSKQFIKPIPRLEKLSKEIIDHFENARKISNNTLLRFKITEAKEWMPKAKNEVTAICFNYFINEELVNIKYRAANKDFKMSKDAQLIFYNLDAIKDTDTCIIVEGEIDCLSLHECGIYNSVSVPNGAAPGVQKLEYLDHCWQYFENKKKVILMVDNDQPGYLLRDELARRLGYEKCYRVEYPEGCKDANEVLVKLGKEAVVSTVNGAAQWPLEGVLSMMDLYNDVLNYYENGYPQGVKAGIPDFDDLLSFMPGQFTTVTGVPGSGKSEFIDYIMCQTARMHQWSWGVCSFENQPSSLHATKLMEKFSGKAFSFRKDVNHRMNTNEFNKSAEMVEKYFHFMNISTVDISLHGLLDKAKELVIRKGIKGLLIDPWNHIEHKIPSGYTETQYISECLTSIKNFALRYSVHIFLVAHPTKLKKEKNKYEIPTMYSISGSAHFFNKTDNGISVWRDFETNTVDIYVQKVRYSWLGKIGFCTLFYDTYTRQYKYVRDLENEEKTNGFVPVSDLF